MNQVKLRILFVVTGIVLAGCGGGGGGGSGTPDAPVIPSDGGGSPDVPPPDGGDGGGDGGVPTIVKEGVKVLPEDSVTIVSVGTDGTVTLRGNVPDMRPGEVIISGTGEGLARKVMSVSSSGGDVVLATQQATLTDIFEQVDLNLERMLGEADLSAEPAPPPKQDPEADGGVGLSQQPLANAAWFKMPFDRVLFDHPNGKMRLYGQGSVGVDLGVRINIRPGENWSARAVPTLSGNFNATLESTLSAWVNQRTRLAYWRLNPITVQVGVPVVLVPVIEMYALANLEANAGFRMTVGGDAMARAGFEWTPSTGMKGIADSRFTPSFQLNGAARMKGNVTLRAELSLLVYGVVGVSGSVDIPAISAAVSASGNGFAYAVDGRLGGGVGFNATLLNWKLVDQYIRVFDSPAISLGHGRVESTGLANSTIEFSPTSNTGGRWRYGWMSGYGEAFQPYTTPVTADGITAWTDPARGGELSLYYNGTNQTLHPSGTITIAPRTVALHPGPRGEYSILRFVAPVGGRYRFTAIFKGLSGWAGSPPTTTTVGVSRGLEGFGGAHLNQNGHGNSAGFNNAVFLDAGDALDFYAGPDGDHRWDSTEVHVEIWPES